MANPQAMRTQSNYVIPTHAEIFPMPLSDVTKKDTGENFFASPSGWLEVERMRFYDDGTHPPAKQVAQNWKS